MTFLPLQSALKSAGYDPGALDGIWGAKTLAALMAYGAQRKATQRTLDLASGLISPMVGKDITTPLRIVHFLGQCCHESGGWQYLVELGGPSYFTRYDGRLGNGPGEGYIYRGRGIIQITGKANYQAYGKKLALNLVDHPEIAAQPDVAARIAVQYWDDHGLNAPADKDDINTITRAINGGVNGLADRSAILARLKAVWGLT